jgi:adenosine/AMP kinase
LITATLVLPIEIKIEQQGFKKLEVANYILGTSTFVILIQDMIIIMVKLVLCLIKYAKPTY